mgnify:CR=1 FL=1
MPFPSDDSSDTNASPQAPGRRDFLAAGTAGLLGLSTDAPFSSGSLTTVPTLAALRDTSGDQAVVVQGYHEPGDGGGGLFVPASSKSITESLAGKRSENALWVSRGGERPPWVRFLTSGEAINVKWFGAKGDGDADASDAINRAIWMAGYLGSRRTQIPAGTYRLDAPIVLTWTSGHTLSGDGALTTTLVKENDSQYRLAPGHSVDAALIIPASRRETQDGEVQVSDAHTITVENLQVKGKETGPRPLERPYGIYVERAYEAAFRNISIAWFRSAFAAEKLWMSRLIRLRGKYIGTLVDLSSNPKEDAIAGASTSLSIENCYCSNDVRGDAFVLRSVYYSTLQNCGADEVSGWPYVVDTCRSITLLGCGFEKSQNGKGITFRGATGNVIGCKGIFPRAPGAEDSSASVFTAESNAAGRPSSVVVMGTHFSNYKPHEQHVSEERRTPVPGRVVESQSSITAIESRFPQTVTGQNATVMHDRGRVSESQASAHTSDVREAAPGTSPPALSPIHGTDADAAINENFARLSEQLTNLLRKLNAEDGE